MLRYLISRTFFFTILLVIGLVVLIGLNDLSNYIQVASIFGWSYFIWHTVAHRKLLSKLLDDGDEEKL